MVIVEVTKFRDKHASTEASELIRLGYLAHCDTVTNAASVEEEKKASKKAALVAGAVGVGGIVAGGILAGCGNIPGGLFMIYVSKSVQCEV